MCGIAGIISSRDNPLTAIEPMLDAMIHRGPDSKGLVSFVGGAFGHNRLEIVDLKSGAQPMTSDKDNILVFNGEIYGYQSIRRKLQYPFKTTSDSEVILALYEEYGLSMLSNLPGMFSFALWDQSNQRLFCARDRAGEKPFYYAFTDNGELIFASEIKAILSTGLINGKIDPNQVGHYLKHLYIHPHKSIYSNIHVLPPAHSLTYHRGNLTIRRYWDIPRVNEMLTFDQASEKFESILRQAISRQLVADVDVGAFLSGGLDSGSIVSIASDFIPNMSTYSLKFQNGNDESQLAKEIALKYNTIHYEQSDSSYDISNLLLKMPSIYDEPFADSSCIPTYILSKFAASHNKVVLTGDGGDELLGGYDFWYKELFSIPDFSNHSKYKKLFYRLISKLGGESFNIFSKKYQEDFSQFSQWRNKDQVFQRHRNRNVYFSDDELDQLGFSKPEESDYRISDYNNNNPEDALRMDFENYLPGDLLVKTDRASMANSLELRSPFLDIDLVEFCFSLPNSLKMDAKEGKKLLREVAKGRLTDNHFSQPKVGFGGPVNLWLSQPSVKELVNDLLTPSGKVCCFIGYSELERIKSIGGYKLWTVLVLAIWLEYI